MSLDLWTLSQTLAHEKVLLCFDGPLSQAVIEQIGEAIRRHLKRERMDDGRLYDVFSIYIEQTQNIRNYLRTWIARDGAAAPDSADHATVALARTDDGGYVVTAGNPVAQADLEGLTARIDALASLDAAALRKRYREQLRAARGETGTNAGLGLLDMARKSSQPLRYEVRHGTTHASLPERTAYFQLIATV
ncbi:SiaB family protein kinase [Chitinasiproducens palmae]|uniref:Uncharacterized protein n=1 Tax=Chitinasiproducens palmae TaxID=1770053 RepID=A0A1H2PTB3_9BURK|nr:SiaB family protein kinase [Chitinasiproducens palmae]SDV49899.1 hypothetical protein SAMN05216551_109224 [Chitinasiproducens palmae]